MRKLAYWEAKTVLLHAPQNIPASDSESQTDGILGDTMTATDLRSRTVSPASFMARPSIFHSASQSGGLSFVSEERPIAFKKSSGVLICSAGRAYGPVPYCNLTGSRGGGMGSRLGASGRMTRERVREGIDGSILGTTSRCKFNSDMAILDALSKDRAVRVVDEQNVQVAPV